MSITVNAVDQVYIASTAVTSVNNNANFDYILALKDTSVTGSPLEIYLSQTPFHVADFYYKSSKKGTCITTGNVGSSSANTYAIVDAALTVNGDIILPFDSCVYISAGTTLSGAVNINKIGASSTAANRYNAPYCIFNGAVTAASTSTYKVWTNSTWSSAEKSAVNSFSNDLESIGIITGITDSEVQELINSALNATTSASTQANSINQQVTNNYISYSNGEISLATLQVNINSLVQQLENLNNQSGTTLADKVAINNAITQTQLVQDAVNKDAIIQEMEEDLTVSSSVSSTITGKINQANQIFNQYTQGSTTQSEAVTQINQYITQLTQLITPQTTTADINAINTAINTINGIKDSVTKHSDLDNSVSESAQNSDKEELEYLENIEAETTDNIDSLKSKVDNSINESQANQVKNNVIAPILQNTLIVKVLPIAALFMVLAVTLGFKYRL